MNTAACKSPAFTRSVEQVDHVGGHVRHQSPFEGADGQKEVVRSQSTGTIVSSARGQL